MLAILMTTAPEAAAGGPAGPGAEDAGTTSAARRTTAGAVRGIFMGVPFR